MESGYGKEDTQFLVNGFKHGFSIGYEGPENRRDESNNIPITVGSKIEMWNKIMKEVKLGRFAGPFKKIPFKNYIQSPIGLVPKANNQTRLIFHLSYNFNTGKETEPKSESLNACTPKELCTVKYNDLDQAVKICLEVSKLNPNHKFFSAKSDILSAFRLVPICKRHWKWLIMKAKHPLTDELVLFVDKCLPFGASISCSHFQKISNGLRHMFEYMSGSRFVVNYLDDFLFVETTKEACDRLVRVFLQVCELVGVPVSLEKTFWGSLQTTFLGILIDGNHQVLSIPAKKRTKALNQIGKILEKKKATVYEIQQLGGLLNFLCKAIHPGRTFTRRMYAEFEGCIVQKGNTLLAKSGRILKKYHHINLNHEFREDCKVWQYFLNNLAVVNRPIIDFQEGSSLVLPIYSDASLNEKLGFGCWFGRFWTFGIWEKNFIKQYKPSIAYLELYALCVGIFTWQYKLRNMRITVFTDNKSARDMINSTVANGKESMKLLRLLTLNNLTHNRRVFAKYIKTTENYCADGLSRLDFNKFFKHAPKNVHSQPDKLPEELWPLSKLWE